MNNELVHGRFFEQKTGDPLYTQHMFKAIHQADPKPTLFLNDYAVVSLGQVTQVTYLFHQLSISQYICLHPMILNVLSLHVYMSLFLYQSYLSQINDFKAANIGLGAVGVQSHFNDPSYEPNTDVLKV